MHVIIRASLQVIGGVTCGVGRMYLGGPETCFGDGSCSTLTVIIPVKGCCWLWYLPAAHLPPCCGVPDGAAVEVRVST